MTANPIDNPEPLTDDQVVARGIEAAARMRECAKLIDQARESQPERLAAARAEAEEARGWALIEEPWAHAVTAIPTYRADGTRTGDAIGLPTVTAKELWGARLVFDLLDCGDDHDRISEVQERIYTECQGDTAQLFLIAFAALATVASVVVPQLLEEIETKGGNWDARVMLAQARTKSWSARASALHDTDGDSSATTQSDTP